jgi:hypothetical protein
MKRRRGRPSVVKDTGSASASTVLPLPVHDRLVQLALRRQIPVSQLLRTATIEYLSRARDANHP